MHNVVIALSTLPAAMAEMKAKLEHVAQEAEECHGGQKDLWDRLDKRDEAREAERRSDRRVIWTAGGAIIAAIAAAATTVILAAPHA
jgi:hypothetical protein